MPKPHISVVLVGCVPKPHISVVLVRLVGCVRKPHISVVLVGGVPKTHNSVVLVGGVPKTHNSVRRSRKSNHSHVCGPIGEKSLGTFLQAPDFCLRYPCGCS